MWTYEAEAKGARTICYFYSTCETVKLPSGYESQHYEWGAASWPFYLVWDSYQENVIRRDIDKEAAIEVVGPIWFSDSEIKLPQLKGINIGVFDIQPRRKAIYFGMVNHCDLEIEHPDFKIRFLEDVSLVLKESGVNMIIKKKREIGVKGERKYQKTFDELTSSPNVLVVSPTVSPIRVIQKCDAVISMPFTATAHYGVAEEGMNVYYDPTGWIQKGDVGAHGVPIITGIDELRNWVQVVIDRFSKKA
jgi:polysaccharide biosynthesis PFTS motif protein